MLLESSVKRSEAAAIALNVRQSPPSPPIHLPHHLNTRGPARHPPPCSLPHSHAHPSRVARTLLLPLSMKFPGQPGASYLPVERLQSFCRCVFLSRLQSIHNCPGLHGPWHRVLGRLGPGRRNRPNPRAPPRSGSPASTREGCRERSRAERVCTVVGRASGLRWSPPGRCGRAPCPGVGMLANQAASSFCPLLSRRSFWQAWGVEVGDSDRAWTALLMHSSRNRERDGGALSPGPLSQLGSHGDSHAPDPEAHAPRGNRERQAQ